MAGTTPSRSRLTCLTELDVRETNYERVSRHVKQRNVNNFKTSGRPVTSQVSMSQITSLRFGKITQTADCPQSKHLGFIRLMSC